MESEQTWIFNVPLPSEKSAPSASWCTSRTGFIGVHCACSESGDRDQNIETSNRGRDDDRSRGAFMRASLLEDWGKLRTAKDNMANKIDLVAGIQNKARRL